MLHHRRTALARTGTLALLCVFAGTAGWATSTMATGGIAVPGTTITVPTNKDGSADLRNLDLAALLAGITLPSGMTLPTGVTLPGGITLPKGLTLPSGTVPPSLLGGTTGTTSAPTLPTAGVVPTTTAVTPTSPVPSGVVPATTIPNPLGTSTTTTTSATTAASNKSDDRLATLLLVLVGGLLLVTALVFAAARIMGWEPDWWSGRRHQTSEAAWRTSNTWADFSDWVRFRR